jgi:GT2 family glycosyltransferase
MCFSSLFSNNWQAGDELIVVDNASTDGTPEYLQELMRRNSCVQVLFNRSNDGFAAANNRGLAAASGDILILLNNDTLTPPGWREGFGLWLNDPTVGLVGPVTNRTCNEAQIDAPYRTYGELVQFARDYTRQRRNEARDLDMLAMFCLAMRREVHQRVGPLDEQFELGMFEDDDYALRVRLGGWRVICAEDVFVHHFGQGSFGQLRATGEYDRLFRSNRNRFERKWSKAWQPPRRRVTPEYEKLRRRIREVATRDLPDGCIPAVISMGDEELLRLNGHSGWHFPQEKDGSYASSYPADAADAIAQLERLRAKGANFLLIPKPAFWWLEYYTGFKAHLEGRCQRVIRDEEACFMFDLRVSP